MQIPSHLHAQNAYHRRVLSPETFQMHHPAHLDKSSELIFYPFLDVSSSVRAFFRFSYLGRTLSTRHLFHLNWNQYVSSSCAYSCYWLAWIHQTAYLPKSKVKYLMYDPNDSLATCQAYICDLDSNRHIFAVLFTHAFVRQSNLLHTQLAGGFWEFFT